jgi:hypothetical protein
VGFRGGSAAELQFCVDGILAMIDLSEYQEVRIAADSNEAP